MPFSNCGGRLKLERLAIGRRRTQALKADWVHPPLQQITLSPFALSNFTRLSLPIVRSLDSAFTSSPSSSSRIRLPSPCPQEALSDAAVTTVCVLASPSRGLGDREIPLVLSTSTGRLRRIAGHIHRETGCKRALSSLSQSANSPFNAWEKHS